MIAYQSVGYVLLFLGPSFGGSIPYGGHLEPADKEKQECGRELLRISAWDKSLAPGPTNDLSLYQKNADAIQRKWSQRNKECYARLMLALCGPLGSGRFKSSRQYDLARQYALSALEHRDSIPLDLELTLTGYVTTSMIGPNAPKGKDFAEHRRKDVEVRLHAWKRLEDAVDPNWNPNEMPPNANAVAADMGFPGAIAPEEIRDVVLRAKYKAAIEESSRKIRQYTEQQRARLWLKMFPKWAERLIVNAYSNPPCNTEELRKSLDEHKVGAGTKARILDAVAKNCGQAKH
jgi:hypothetical protein